MPQSQSMEGEKYETLLFKSTFISSENFLYANRNKGLQCRKFNNCKKKYHHHEKRLKGKSCGVGRINLIPKNKQLIIFVIYLFY